MPYKDPELESVIINVIIESMRNNLEFTIHNGAKRTEINASVTLSDIMEHAERKTQSTSNSIVKKTQAREACKVS